MDFTNFATMKTWVWLSVLLLGGCKGFLGEKTSTDFIDVPKYDAQAVAFVPVQPALTGFVKPVDVLAGFDELLYVADQGAGQIVCLDQSGRELSRFSLPGVKAIAQCLPDQSEWNWRVWSPKCNHCPKKCTSVLFSDCLYCRGCQCFLKQNCRFGK